MFRSSSIATLVLIFLISTAHAQRNPDWVPLGELSVARVNHDVINIGQPEDWFRSRSFRTLYLAAERTEVFMMTMRLVYLNGYTEDLRIDSVIPAGGQLAVDLGGEKSYLKKIEMVYRARADFSGDAVIKVFGERVRPVPPPPPPPPANTWTELGCQQVAPFGRDRESIGVGHPDGRFRSVRLQIRDADVEVQEVSVVYTNGQADTIGVQNVIRAGDRTRPLDLMNPPRVIDHFDMAYRTALNPAALLGPQGIRAATVCVEALQW